MLNIFDASLNLLFDRERFLNESRLELSANIRSEHSISIFKFIGRQHSYLSEIMDEINFCYSFQVTFRIVIHTTFKSIVIETD